MKSTVFLLTLSVCVVLPSCVSSRIKLNPCTMYPQALKTAVIPETGADSFNVVNVESGKTVLRGNILHSITSIKI